MRRFAYPETITHCRQGLTLLQALPETSERHRQELYLLLSLAPAVMMTKGRAMPEVEQTYVRARDLCVQLDDTAHLFLVLQGLSSHYGSQGAHQSAKEMGKQMLSMAQQQGDPVGLMLAHKALGNTLYFQGELSAACEHLEQGRVLYTTQRYRTQEVLMGTERDRGVSCFSFGAHVLWLLGYPDQARACMGQALTLAQELAHPMTLVHTVGVAIMLAS